MASLNKVQLIGNLCRDPDLRFTPSGTAICKITLAVNRKWKTESGELKEDVTFVDCDFFGRNAENIGQYLKKGSVAYIEGRLKLDQWDDKATGQKRQKLGVIGENVQFLSPPSKDAPARRESAPLTHTPDEPTRPTTESGEPQPPEGDVPF